jgi:hypothetical protein
VKLKVQGAVFFDVNEFPERVVVTQELRIEPLDRFESLPGKLGPLLPVLALKREPCPLDTSAPLHQDDAMRLTVNLESAMYALAKSLSREEGCTISAAVNRLLRRSVTGAMERNAVRVNQKAKRGGFVVSRGAKPITADMVRRAERQDDES